MFDEIQNVEGCGIETVTQTAVPHESLVERTAVLETLGL